MTTGTGKGFVPQFQLRTLVHGIPLLRATVTLPQTAVAAIFNIVGGRVLLTSFIGEVTVQLGGAVGNMSFNENPTAGTTELVSSAVAVNNLPIGDCVGMVGTDAAALVPAAAGNTPDMATTGRVLRIGTLEVEMTGNGVGSVRWLLTYIPLDDGAYMTVA